MNVVKNLVAVAIPPLQRLDTKFFHLDEYGMYIEECVYLGEDYPDRSTLHTLREVDHDLRRRLAIFECTSFSIVQEEKELRKYSMIMELMR